MSFLVISDVNKNFVTPNLLRPEKHALQCSVLYVRVVRDVIEEEQDFILTCSTLTYPTGLILVLIFGILSGLSREKNV